MRAVWLRAVGLDARRHLPPRRKEVKVMKDEVILSPEMDEELSNGKGEDEDE